MLVDLLLSLTRNVLGACGYSSLPNSWGVWFILAELETFLGLMVLLLLLSRSLPGACGSFYPATKPSWGLWSFTLTKQEAFLGIIVLLLSVTKNVPAACGS